MSNIDASIARGTRKRKIMLLTSSVILVAVLSIYFAWLFLTQGYRILVKPESIAASAQIQLVEGVGIVVNDAVYLLGASAKVEVSAHKYASKQIAIWPHTNSNISIELEPLPAQVLLRANLEFDDIRWELNGKLHSKSKQLQMQLEPGQYQVTANHPYYQSETITITAEMAGKIDKTLELTPVEGELQLDSEPSGAEVSINGKVAGVTPFTISQRGGAYSVALSLPGYQTLNDTIQLTESTPQPKRNYLLTPKQGVLQVDLQPTGGALLHNGAPAVSPIALLANKAHVISYSKAGFIGQSQQINVKPGERQTVSFKLAPETGRVSFESEPRAEVLINGKSRGQTPLSLSLQTLPTEVVMQKLGYRSQTFSITPSPRKSQKLTAELLTEFDARRKDGQALFISSLGIEMNLVEPSTFTMGSAVNEPYRNRNERQRKVAFSRPVWVAKHEITQGQYAAFIASTNAKTNKSQNSSDANFPVTNISWLEAARFCNWLSAQEGLLPFYNIVNNKLVGINIETRGYRLPSEAEWEYIARRHKRSSAGKYVWGEQDRLKDNQGNFADETLKGKQTFVLADYKDGFSDKAPVGSFDASRGGFYDLDGNVREWVHDRYSVAVQSDKQVETDYLGALSGEGNVVKGASFKTGRLKNIRASVRSGENQGADDIGFRIARYHR